MSSIDHGATPPSALSARNVASTGATLSASVAAGIMSINRHHGGAIEDCARQLKAIADRAARDSISLEEAATRTLRTMSEAGERMSGFGHRVHTKDPRTARLFELAREAGVDGVHMQVARAVEKAFADAKKSLPINVDGAIGAILADLGMNPASVQRHFHDRAHTGTHRACHRRTDARETDAPNRSGQPRLRRATGQKSMKFVVR